MITGSNRRIRAARPASFTWKRQARSPHTSPNSASLNKRLWDVVKYFAVLTTIGGVLLHLMGMSAHRTYLRSWGIDHGLFDKPADWILFNSYYVLVNQMANLHKVITTEIGMIIGWLVLVGLGAWGVVSLNAWQPSNRAFHESTPRWVKNLIQIMIFTFMGFAALVAGLSFAIVLSAFPALLGEQYGTDLAEKHHVVFKEGCPSGASNLQCISLLREGQTIARGFLIESSNTHIAIFDVDQQQSRALERQGTELKSLPLVATQQQSNED